MQAFFYDKFFNHFCMYVRLIFIFISLISLNFIGFYSPGIYCIGIFDLNLLPAVGFGPQ